MAVVIVVAVDAKGKPRRVDKLALRLFLNSESQ